MIVFMGLLLLQIYKCESLKTYFSLHVDIHMCKYVNMRLKVESR